MPAIKIENARNIAARAKFVNMTVFPGQSAHAHVEVTFEQKETGYGLGREHPLDGLVISATLSNPGIEGCPSYGWSALYSDTYFRIEMKDAERMYRLLTQLDRAMTKADQQMGRCMSFGQYVVRVCNLLGVDYGMADNGHSNRMDMVHYPRIGEFTYPIDERIREKNADWGGARFWRWKK